MSGLLVNLVFQIIGGALGGNIAAGAMKNGTLGKVDNIIAGAIGGGVGGQILGALIPMLSNTASTPDIGLIIGQVVGGGVSGAILIAVVGALKSRMA
ncbi:putative membrane protein YeaQ/YmgE (transglycosylase-associated protein family) [Nitrobacteraceae bacterium AZCC 1564]